MSVTRAEDVDHIPLEGVLGADLVGQHAAAPGDQVVSHPKNLTILPIVNNVVYRINTERDNEYFILENRQQSGWDSFVPGHGMLVWHIDYNPNIWDRNVVSGKSMAYPLQDVIPVSFVTLPDPGNGKPAA